MRISVSFGNGKPKRKPAAKRKGLLSGITIENVDRPATWAVYERKPGDDVFTRLPVDYQGDPADFDPSALYRPDMG